MVCQVVEAVVPHGDLDHGVPGAVHVLPRPNAGVGPRAHGSLIG